MAIVQPAAYGVEVFHCNHEAEKVPTLKARDWKDPNVVAYRQGGFADYIEGEIGTLRASGGDLAGGTESLVVNAGTRYIVRRLTPLECERLQGFPDGWTDIGEWVDSKGKKHKTSDSLRYKALGNSISIPNWKYIIKRLCAHYERDATMASLFDGIGGFPYIWEQLNGKGSCLWASEIEEFPMAVTKMRFGGAE
jgi:DNA (cytosine-5)-methyltransferase 1